MYLSDRHLKNAVRRFEELVSDVEEMRDFAPERDQTWAEQKVEEVEDTLMMLEQEVERRKREKVVVREVGNPYYED